MDMQHTVLSPKQFVRPVWHVCPPHVGRAIVQFLPFTDVYPAAHAHVYEVDELIDVVVHMVLFPHCCRHVVTGHEAPQLYRRMTR